MANSSAPRAINTRCGGAASGVPTRTPTVAAATSDSGELAPREPRTTRCRQSRRVAAASDRRLRGLPARNQSSTEPTRVVNLIATERTVGTRKRGRN